MRAQRACHRARPRGLPDPGPSAQPLHPLRVGLPGLGIGSGAATLWRDVQAVAPGRAPDPQAQLPPWVEVDETWLSLGGVKRPMAVVPGPKGERPGLRPGGPGFDWADWFTDLAARGVRG